MALDMNYTPTRLVDITTLTEDQWLDWRKKGIGGSDVAAIDGACGNCRCAVGDGGNNAIAIHGSYILIA